MHYDISEFKLDGVVVKFDKGILIVESYGYQKDWNGDLQGIHPSLKLKSNNCDCEITTSDGERFKGSIMIQSYENLPLGDNLSFLGNGMLEKVN